MTAETSPSDTFVIDPPDNAVERLANHEAGHAVIGRVLDMICGDVTIEADEDSAGHSIAAEPYKILYAWEQREKYRYLSTVLVGRIMTFMAGWAAEVEFFGSCPAGDQDDCYQVALMMDMMDRLDIPEYHEAGDGAVERYEARLRARTRGLVRRHRDKIERVAAALLIYGSLTAEQVETIMQVSRNSSKSRRKSQAFCPYMAEIISA